ncbi:hypothetical protein MY10362_004379 [Beauveria mimosiformis]
MEDTEQLKIIEENPIGHGLDIFRASFTTTCEVKGISCTPDALEQLGQEGKRQPQFAQTELSNHNLDVRYLASDLILALRRLRAPLLLRSSCRGNNLLDDLVKLMSEVNSAGYDLGHIKPLLQLILFNKVSDVRIWRKIYDIATQSTPPPQSAVSSLLQTPLLRHTGSFANSSEHRKYVDDVLKEELGPMYVGLRGFHDVYFQGVVGLEEASHSFFHLCRSDHDIFSDGGWNGWPKGANQDAVLSWLADFIEKLAKFADNHASSPTHQRRRPLALPNRPIRGSTGERKLDIGFVSDPEAKKDSRYHWAQILIPGELKSNPSADMASKAWLDLGRYAREVLAAQSTRRFVLGFTICGSLMRIWVFDRLGGVASEKFDINEDGLQFVSTVLGFLWMSEEQLGFDPTIRKAGEELFIEIERNGSTERIIIDKELQRIPCIAGRATTCWKAHLKGHTGDPLVIKDSWQYPERDEEGELSREVTDTGQVVNVARYYYHETVKVRGADDEVLASVRGGLDVKTASNYLPQRSVPSSGAYISRASRRGRASGSAGQKRSSSQTSAALPPKKRSCSASPTKASSDALRNRIHRRVILRDYGKPIYEASSRLAFLRAIEGCIKGHESLYNAGFLHRDISINNLMINEDDDNPSWPSFIIDLDLAIRNERQYASGAEGKTGTRAFMAIGTLLGEQHSFMHDLESFFWVIFWVCVHYERPGQGRVVPRFDKWNYMDLTDLATYKAGIIGTEEMFLRSVEENFSIYHRPIIPWINKLRKEVFPNGRKRDGGKKDRGLYLRMREILEDATKDPEVLASWTE